MNTQHLVLSVLIRGAASGYDIKKELETRVSIYLDISPSGVYPALAELTEKGYVKYQRVEQEARPAKKIYEITELGRQHFFSEMRKIFLKHSVRSEVLYALSIADYLPLDRVEQIIDERYAFSEDIVKELRAQRRDALAEGRHGLAFVLGYGIAISEAGNDFIEDEKDRLMKDLGAGLPGLSARKG